MRSPRRSGALLADPAALAIACADGNVAVVGDLLAISRLLNAVADAWPSGDQTGHSQERHSKWPVPTPDRSAVR